MSNYHFKIIIEQNPETHVSHLVVNTKTIVQVLRTRSVMKVVSPKIPTNLFFSNEVSLISIGDEKALALMFQTEHKKTPYEYTLDQIFRFFPGNVNVVPQKLLYEAMKDNTLDFNNAILEERWGDGDHLLIPLISKILEI